MDRFAAAEYVGNDTGRSISPPAPTAGATAGKERIAMAVDAHYRDKDGEFSRKHGNALVGRLRTSYGGGFAQGCANDDKLSDVLVKLDERSLYKLVRDYKSGMLPIRLRTPWIIAPRP